MKRKPYGAMIAITVAAMLALFTCLMIIDRPFGSRPVFSNRLAEIECENAPEGTAYIDVLGKLPNSNDRYVHNFKKPSCLPEGVTEESEIASYNEDNYVSLSLRYGNFLEYNENGQMELVSEMPLGSSMYTLRKRCGNKFKLAFVGENGNILEVTKKASVRYSPMNGYAFASDGNKLTLTLSEAHPIKWGLLLVLSALPIVLIVLIILSIKQHVTYGRPKKSDNDEKNN